MLSFQGVQSGNICFAYVYWNLKNVYYNLRVVE
jgi:hypothetical protein